MNRSEAGGSGGESRPAGRLSLTLQCLLGLVLGLLLGALVSRLQPEVGAKVTGFADGTIRAWSNAFRLIIPFLVFAQLFVAVVARRPTDSGTARLGLLLPAILIGLLVGMVIGTLLIMKGLLALPILRDATLNLPSAGAAPAAAAAGQVATSWIDDVIPSNLVAAAGGSNILPLMLFALVFALAARRLAPDHRRVLESGFTAVRDALFVMVRWLVQAAPVMLFVVGSRFAVGSGLTIGGLLLAFAAIKIGMVLLWTGVLYAVSCLAGPYSLRRFGRAMAPAQLIAIATRSSLATVPALLTAANRDLGIRPMVSSLAIPLAGATFKPSRAIQYPVTLLFLAHIVGVPLGLEQIAVFMLTVLPLVITTAGVPYFLSGSRSTPAYVAVGIPAQYVVLFGAVTAISDVFETMLNTTGYMAANVLVARLTPQATLGAGQPTRPDPAQAVTEPLQHPPAG